MKLGFGLYRHMLTRDNYDFAKQCGATHVIVHLCDYFNQGGAENPAGNQPVGGFGGWGRAADTDDVWSLELLKHVKQEINDAGLELAGLENFDPGFWYDVLLDGPRKHTQMEGLKTLIRRVGEAARQSADAPVFGYNFSLAGVAGRVKGRFARGGAESVGMDGTSDFIEQPIPKGMIWNMVYDADAGSGVQPTITYEELWRRLAWFLEQLVPVAEEAGVVLAAHPDDPPLPVVRQQPRLVYQPWMYQRLIDIVDSPSNQLEFCLGTLSEMTEGDIYEATDRYTQQHKVAYIHFRNVRGTVPTYKETFIDEGDIDMHRILRILKKNDFQGVLIPDHTPLMTCDAPWHAGMAFAMGYMRSAMKVYG